MIAGRLGNAVTSFRTPRWGSPSGCGLDQGRVEGGGSGQVLGEGRLEGGILGVGGDGAVVVGVAGEVEVCGAGVALVVGDGGDGEVEVAVGEGKAVAEGPVGAELDGALSDGDVGIWFGGTVDDEFGVDVEPEVFWGRGRGGE